MNRCNPLVIRWAALSLIAIVVTVVLLENKPGELRGPDRKSLSSESLKTDSSVPQSPAVEEEPVFIAEASLKEISSGDPLVRKFVDAKGELAKLIRTNEAGLTLLETEYKDGQQLTLEKIYADDGRLLRERKLRNGVLLEDAVKR
jgi:hypothetical protein